MSSATILDARTATDHFPGIGRYVAGLAGGLVRVEPAWELLLLHDPTAPVGRLSLTDLPRLSCGDSPFSLRQQWSVPALLREAGARLYHSPYYLMPYRVPPATVFTCYDLIPLQQREFFSAGKRLIYRFAHLLACRSAAVILAISATTKIDLLRVFRLAPEKVRVTPLAADARFAPLDDPPAVARWRQRAGLPERYLLYLGSNKPHKNLPRLVQAWRVVLDQWQRRHGEPPALVLAGQEDGRYPQARRLTESLGLAGRVLFRPDVPDWELPWLYNGAMAFVFPSLYEGFGLPVLEAMACGAPVACSEASSLPEVAGDAAVFFDPAEAESIAAALRRLAGDAELRAELRRRGLRRAAQFTWERTARQTLEAYRSLLPDAGG